MNSELVKIDGPANLGDLHRTISLSKKMVDAGLWDGEGKIIWSSAKCVVDAIAKTQLFGKLVVASEMYKIEREPPSANDAMD